MLITLWGFPEVMRNHFVINYFSHKIYLLNKTIVVLTVEKRYVRNHNRLMYTFDPLNTVLGNTFKYLYDLDQINFK